MKQRKTFAIVLTIILILATVLTVFAAFRFEVQFPSKLNTYTYDETTAKFAGTYSFDADLTQLQEPGQGAEFAATVTGDANTPLTYAYTISVDGYSVNDITILDADDDATKTAKSEKIALLSSVFVKLNDKIVGTLYSVIKDHAGLLGEGLYVLPGATENDTLRLELHLASDATPYENASLKVTVNCTATNHNAQQMSFVRDAAELAQAISEVNRGAADKTIVMYGGFEVPANLEVQKPCTFDVQDVTFAGPIAVNITSEPVDNIPTDIVTVLSTKSTCTAASGFSITAGAIDRKDSASNITISGIENATSESVQYIIDNQIASVEAHGIAAGQSIDFSGKGFLCYIESIDAETGSLLSYADNKLTAGNTEISTVEKVTITLATADNATHTHNIKVIGKGDEAAALFEENGDLYYLTQLAQPGIDVSYSIPLPTVLKNKNATIEWHSSDPEKFSNQGVCSPSANGYVTLTAVIRINEDVYTHDVKIHIATLTNEDRLEAMIAAMGNLTLNTIWTGSHQNGKLDQVFMPVTTQQSDGSWQQTYVDSNGVTQELSTFDITNIELTIDEEAYGYIGFQNGTEFVVLDHASFQTMALVNIKATFATGEPKEVPSTICVNIQLGSDTTLGDQVLEYVQSQMNNVDVLQNMLDTRVTGEERGDFTLPVEYNGFEIVYTIDGETAASVSGGDFTVYPEHFETSYYSVPVDVKVLIKGATEVTEENTIASRTMYFDVPPVITTDQYGFANVDLFKNVRDKVNSNLPESERWTSGDADNKYILLRDIEKCTSLSIDGSSNGTSSINGLAYFTNLTKFEAKNFDSSFAASLARVAATYTKLTELTLSKNGLTDITPLQSLTGLTKLDISGNADLKDITGLVNYDATQLEELNISGTAVNMTHARPMLTDMYYKYMSGNSNATPKYYYTHEYTPIADGALLLEPDAISVSGSTATVAGNKITISNLDGSYKALAGGAMVQIDGEKSIATPVDTQFTVVKGTYVYSSGNLTIENAIVTFNLGTEETKSSVSKIEDLLFEEAIILTNASVSGTKITTGAGSVLRSEAGNFSDIPYPNTTIPIVYGVIEQVDLNNDDIKESIRLSPLKNADGSAFRNNYVGVTDSNGSTTIAHANLNKIIITGGSISPNTPDTVSIGADGGTIEVVFSDKTSFKFAVTSSVNIDIGLDTQREVSGGTITLTAVDTDLEFNNQTEVTFSSATISNDYSYDGNIIPTIVTGANCIMSVGNVSIPLPQNALLTLPENSIGSQNATEVKIQSNTASSIGSTVQPGNTSTTIQILNAAAGNWSAQYSGSYGIYARAYVYDVSASNACYLVYNNTWIPITYPETRNYNGQQVGSFTLFSDIEASNITNISAAAGTISTSNRIVTVSMTSITKVNSALSVDAAASFSYSLSDIRDSSDNTPITFSGTVDATLPTTAINPQFVGVRATTTQEDPTALSQNKAVYYGKEYEIFDTIKDATGAVINSNLTWYAIRLDGEYITLSDGATYSIATLSDGTYEITVTGGTSTIGKGALLATTQVNATHTTATPTAPTGIYTIAGTDTPEVLVTYDATGSFVLAKVDHILFEPLSLKDEEVAGLEYLFLLSEVPGVTHYTVDGHGSYIQLASIIIYDVTGNFVKPTWEIVSGGEYVKVSNLGSLPRLETYRDNVTFSAAETAAKSATREVTIRAQVNVQGLVTTRYFTFTVTYFTN